MPKRTVCIQNPARVSIRHRSLQVRNDAGVHQVPLEDIWVVILESGEVQLTSGALSALADAGVGVMLCGRDHMPSGLSLPLGAHSRHAAIVEHQLAMSKPLRKRLWKSIVTRKIENQARVLDLVGLPGADRLRAEAGAVLSGDATNREAVAAAEYFRRLIPDGTRRDSAVGSCLDYAYAVLRAGLGRAAVAGGWLVSRGIHHCSDANAFNLVDDLIEPFRPVADLLVMEGLDSPVLDPRGKGALASVFEYLVAMGGRRYTVQTAIDHMLDSLERAVLEGDPELLVLPAVIGLDRYDGEDT